MKFSKFFILAILLTVILSSCGSGADIVSTPIENIDNTPLKESDLTKNVLQF